MKLKNVSLFINKNPSFISILLGLLLFIVAGTVYYDLEIMFIVLLGVVIFGVFIGLISAIIKMFFR